MPADPITKFVAALALDTKKLVDFAEAYASAKNDRRYDSLLARTAPALAAAYLRLGLEHPALESYVLATAMRKGAPREDHALLDQVIANVATRFAHALFDEADRAADAPGNDVAESPPATPRNDLPAADDGPAPVEAQEGAAF